MNIKLNVKFEVVIDKVKKNFIRIIICFKNLLIDVYSCLEIIIFFEFDYICS